MASSKRKSHGHPLCRIQPEICIDLMDANGVTTKTGCGDGANHLKSNSQGQIVKVGSLFQAGVKHKVVFSAC